MESKKHSTDESILHWSKEIRKDLMKSLETLKTSIIFLSHHESEIKTDFSAIKMIASAAQLIEACTDCYLNELDANCHENINNHNNRKANP